MSPVKVSLVKYLNSRPFLYGLQQPSFAGKISLSLDIPAVGAEKLKSGEVNLALIPVAMIPQIENAKIVSNYCIATEGAVQTVCLYSYVPIGEIDIIYLDYHSRTSVQLLRILLKEHWNVSPKLLAANPGFRNNIKGNTAGLVIGDRAIGMEDSFPFVYDLGSEWKKVTGLPFVFAAWASAHFFNEAFLETFETALQIGISEIDKVLENCKSETPPGFDLKTYLTQNISFEFNAEKRKALALFYEKMLCLK